MGTDQSDLVEARIRHLQMRLGNYRASRERAPAAHLPMFDLLIQEAEHELGELCGSRGSRGSRSAAGQATEASPGTHGTIAALPPRPSTTGGPTNKTNTTDVPEAAELYELRRRWPFRAP